MSQKEIEDLCYRLALYDRVDNIELWLQDKGIIRKTNKLMGKNTFTDMT